MAELRIRDLSALLTPDQIDELLNLVIPLDTQAGSSHKRRTYQTDILTFRSWLAQNGMANTDLSNLSEAGQEIIDHKYESYQKEDDTDLNDITTTGRYFVKIGSSIDKNQPAVVAIPITWVVEVVAVEEENLVYQKVFSPQNQNDKVWFRLAYDGGWSPYVLVQQNQENPTFKTPHISETPLSGDRSDLAANTEWVQGELDKRDFIEPKLLLGGIIDTAQEDPFSFEDGTLTTVANINLMITNGLDTVGRAANIKQILPPAEFEIPDYDEEKSYRIFVDINNNLLAVDHTLIYSELNDISEISPSEGGLWADLANNTYRYFTDDDWTGIALAPLCDIVNGSVQKLGGLNLAPALSLRKIKDFVNERTSQFVLKRVVDDEAAPRKETIVSNNPSSLTIAHNEYDEEGEVVGSYSYVIGLLDEASQLYGHMLRHISAQGVVEFAVADGDVSIKRPGWGEYSAVITLKELDSVVATLQRRLVAGTGIKIDYTNPLLPVISAVYGAGGGGSIRRLYNAFGTATLTAAQLEDFAESQGFPAPYDTITITNSYDFSTYFCLPRDRSNDKSYGRITEAANLSSYGRITDPATEMYSLGNLDHMSGRWIKVPGSLVT